MLYKYVAIVTVIILNDENNWFGNIPNIGCVHTLLIGHLMA